MLRFLARRSVQSVVILIGVTMITFGLSFLIPADPVRLIAGRSATPETVESIRHQLGLDQPIPMQYLRYLGNLVQGDLGRSYVQRVEVNELIASRLPATLQLMAAAILFELLLGLPAGVDRSQGKVQQPCVSLARPPVRLERRRGHAQRSPGAGDQPLQVR